MKSFIANIAKKVFEWAAKEDVIAIYLPADVVEREATSSEDLVDEDLYFLHYACVEAWRSKNRP